MSVNVDHEKANARTQSPSAIAAAAAAGAVAMGTFGAIFATCEPSGDAATDTAAWIAGAAAIAAGGTFFPAPGTYTFNAQVTISAPANSQASLLAFGAEIQTTGAISGLKITGGDSTGGLDVYGIRINHRGNASATCGFDIAQAWRANLHHCYVEAHGVDSAYSAFRIRNGTAADENTGSFWTTLDHCGCRKRSGSDSGDIPVGIEIRGASNATQIDGGTFGNCTIAIKHITESGQTYHANHLVVAGACFEGYGTVYAPTVASGVVFGSWKFLGCRFESGTNVYDLTGVSASANFNPQPGVTFGNTYIASCGTIVTNPNSVPFSFLDYAQTPATGKTTLWTYDGLVIRPGGSLHPLEVWAPTGNRGVRLMESTGTSIVDLSWTGTSTEAILRSSSNKLFVRGIKSAHYQPQTAEPVDPDTGLVRQGTVAFADGSTWNPGSGGAGLYVCTVGGAAGVATWVKLH